MHQRVSLIGNLGQEPSIKTIAGQNGDFKVGALSVATTETFRGQRHTEWHRVVATGRVAEIVDSPNYAKGKQVFVDGRLRTRKYKDDKGIVRQITEILADMVRLTGPAPAAATNAGDIPLDAYASELGDTEGGQTPAVEAEAHGEDDIPF